MTLYHQQDLYDKMERDTWYSSHELITLFYGVTPSKCYDKYWGNLTAKLSRMRRKKMIERINPNKPYAVRYRKIID